MDLYRFVLSILLGQYIGFPRLHQLRFIARDPIVTGILKVTQLPVQSTFWRFVNALHLNVAGQILGITQTLRERVWAAANVKLETVTIDTDTTVHTLYGQQMGDARVTTRRTRARKAISHYSPSLPRRGNTCGVNCAMATGPAASRLAIISGRCVGLCRRA